MSETDISRRLAEIGVSLHRKALVETVAIGPGTRVWAFAHVLRGATIGRDCNLCDHTFVENDVVIGDRVTIKCGVQVWDGLRIEDDVFVGPNATFTNDPFPRSKRYPPAGQNCRTVIKKGASVGANATILPGLTVGERAMVGAGAVVTRNVPDDSIVVGNPARIVGYVGASDYQAPQYPAPELAGLFPTGVKGVTLRRLPRASDLRGMLSYGEVEKEIPFTIKRFFLVYGVPSRDVRGEHAHRELHQFLVCVNGSCRVLADDGHSRQEFTLDDPSLGIHIPPLVWSVQYKHSKDAVLLAFASDRYDPEDYIRHYSEFLDCVRP